MQYKNTVNWPGKVLLYQVYTVLGPRAQCIQCKVPGIAPVHWPGIVLEFYLPGNTARGALLEDPDLSLLHYNAPSQGKHLVVTL